MNVLDCMLLHKTETDSDCSLSTEEARYQTSCSSEDVCFLTGVVLCNCVRGAAERLGERRGLTHSMSNLQLHGGTAHDKGLV